MVGCDPVKLRFYHCCIFFLTIFLIAKWNTVHSFICLIIHLHVLFILLLLFICMYCQLSLFVNSCVTDHFMSILFTTVWWDLELEALAYQECSCWWVVSVLANLKIDFFMLVKFTYLILFSIHLCSVHLLTLVNSCAYLCSCAIYFSLISLVLTC